MVHSNFSNQAAFSQLLLIEFLSFLVPAAWVHGDPRRVAYPTDSNGHFCGQKGTPNENKTILFYFNLFSCTSPSLLVNLQCPTTQICVSKCPEKFLTYMEMHFMYRTRENYWSYYSQFCKAASAKPVKVFVFKFRTREEFSFCFYLNGLTIAMLLSWMFVILLRVTAGFLFWVFILGVIGILAYGIWHCYQEYSKLQEKPNSHLSIYNIGIQTDISMYFQLKQTWFTFMIILAILEVIVIVMLIFLRDRIRVSIALLKEGSKAIGYIPSTLIYPVLTFIFLSICISYWAVTAVYLATSGTPIYKVIAPEGQCEHENKTCDPEIFNTTEIAKACPGAHCNFAFYGGKSLYHQYITTFQIVNLFIFLWLINFVIALGQCTLAGAFASYYWALKKPDDIPPHPLFTAFGRAIRYHTGSLAFGSLILATIQMVRLVLQYLDNRLKDAQSNISRFLQCCLKCCFWCLEHVVKFLNRHAYVMIAIYGQNFCRSARDAFNLLMRNVLKVAVMDRVTEFVLTLGKILVAGCIGILAFLLFTERIPMIVEGPTSLNYYWVPLLTVIIGSYLIAHGFFSVYAMCIDTIFICFCEDLERNDGSAEKPYFIAPTLHGILNKKQLVPQKQKE
uniref:Choline transporter-like protein n=1 Tax=Equus asinus asinus TaxID=83772 RepID=A0A8C4LL88_EQUAS